MASEGALRRKQGRTSKVIRTGSFVAMPQTAKLRPAGRKPRNGKVTTTWKAGD